jgi:hypothetical protein
MTIGRQAKNPMNVSRVLPVLELMLCLLLATLSAHAQSLAGLWAWAASSKTLENGERQKALLDLNQVGDKLSGTLQTLDVIGQVTGRATGTHFELWGVGWNETKPFLVGDLVNGELHATLGDAADVLGPTRMCILRAMPMRHRCHRMVCYCCAFGQQ